MESFYQTTNSTEIDRTQQKLQENKQGKHNFHTACDVVCEQIDSYFYGSLQNKMENLQKDKEKIDKGLNTSALIGLIEESNQYVLSPNFKNRYFKFLDDLLKHA